MEYHEISPLLFLKESRTYAPEELQVQFSGGMLHAEMLPSGSQHCCAEEFVHLRSLFVK